MSTYDLICIGAGPTGLACAIEAKRAGMHPLVIDKGCLCNSLYHYPVNMVFFTTPELLEIGDLPLTSPSEKPTRAEALKYSRNAPSIMRSNCDWTGESKKWKAAMAVLKCIRVTSRKLRRI